MTQSRPNDEMLSAYLDNELSPADRAQVEQRLARDADYAATLDVYRDQRSRLQALPRGSIDVRQQVMRRLNDSASITVDKKKANWQWATAVIGALAALLLVGLFLYLPDAADDLLVANREVELRESADRSEALPMPVDKAQVDRPKNLLEQSGLTDDDFQRARDTERFDDSLGDEIFDFKQLAPALNNQLDTSASEQFLREGVVKSSINVVDGPSKERAMSAPQAPVQGALNDHSAGLDLGVLGRDSKLVIGENVKMDSGFSTMGFVLVQAVENESEPLTLERFQEAVKKTGGMVKPLGIESLEAGKRLYLGRQSISGRRGAGGGGRGGQNSEPSASQSVVFFMKATPQQMILLKTLLEKKAEFLTSESGDAYRYRFAVPEDESGVESRSESGSESSDEAQTYRVVVVLSEDENSNEAASSDTNSP